MRKALSDLRATPGRTALITLALAIGLWGVGSMLVSYTILTRDLRENHIRTSPPHAVLTSKDFGRLDLVAFRSRPEIESAEFRDLSLQRIEVHPEVWVPLYLFGVDDFDAVRLARQFPLEGRASPPPGTMVIERNGRLISALGVGSRARVRSGSRVLELPISGIVFDPGQSPATQDHRIYGYVDKATYAAMTGEIAGQRLLLRFRNPSTNREVRIATERVLDGLKASGIAVGTHENPPLNEHPHQWQLNTLLFLQGSICLLAFLLAAVLVSQVMAAILARQVRQIGIFKALGASRLGIFTIYGSMIAVLAVVAGMLAIPAALATGFAFARFVATKLNFDILTTSLPLRVHIQLAAAALLLPFLLSLTALFKGIGVPVRDALSDYGVRQDACGKGSPGSTGRFLSSSLLLALRNSLRRKKRLAITVLGTALGVAIFSTGFNVRQSLALLLADVRNGARCDVQVVLRDQVAKERALAPFRSLENVARIETGSCGRGEMQSKEFVMNQGAREISGFPAAGEVNSLMFVARDKSYEGVIALKKEIEEAIGPSDLNVLSVMSQAERTTIISDHLDVILTTILITSFMVLAVSAMGMASATGITIMERTREIGVLRAIGATPERIFRLFAAEGMITSVAGIALGLLGSWPLSIVAASFFGNLVLGKGATLQAAFSVSGFGITLVTTLIFGFLASRIPAQRAVSVSTREALAYE
ncbi:MAG TPA: ABC transporter permease [bacterium]